MSWGLSGGCDRAAIPNFVFVFVCDDVTTISVFCLYCFSFTQESPLVFFLRLFIHLSLRFESGRL
jgi:hypothetical protein